MSKPISHEQKIAFCCRRDITLNGEPARIVWPRRPFARVEIRASGLGADWAWETVASVCARDGAFRS